MKKVVVTLCLLGTAAAVFAQGSVTVANTTTTLFRTNSVGIGAAAGSAQSANGGPYIYEVLTAPSTVNTVDSSLQGLLSAPWSDTTLKANNTGIAGRMSSASTTVNNWAISQTNSFVIVGWSASLGADWATVSAKLAGAQLTGGVWSGGGLSAGLSANAFLGATSIGFKQAGGTIGTVTYPTPLLFASAADGQGQPITGPTDLFVIPVPEPTTFALAGLGAAAMLIFRRRKN